MEKLIFNTPEALGEYSAALIDQTLRQKPDALLCISAGDTQRPMLAAMRRWGPEQRARLRYARFILLDEWLGLGADDEGSCAHFMHTQLFTPLEVPADRVRGFDATAQDLRAQCEAADVWLLEQGPIDLLIVGTGMNGHVGFNEPGADPAAGAHSLVLDTLTQAVGQKYFGGKPTPRAGITLGLRDLLAARRVLVQATGAHKAPVIQNAAAVAANAQRMESDPMIPPVARFLALPNTVLAVDYAADSPLLKGK